MKTGHCIICHRDGVDLSDEHVIPDAIGGYYHIYNVCKKCNSNLGDHVDIHLLKQWMIIGARNNKRLVGKTNKLPNPLAGDGIIEDNGTKVRMEEDKTGTIVPHILPKSPDISQDGKSFTIIVDKKDEKLIDRMVKKTINKIGLTPGTFKLDSCRTVHEISQPWIKMQIIIDLKNYKIGLLKIAYEFAVDKIPAYYNDPMAIKYSEILRDADVSRLDEVVFEGEGLLNAEQTLLDDFIDYGKTNRHILMLANINDKLYCMVKLFQNTMCQFIRMSDNEYGENGLVLIALNDFEKRECKFYNEIELIQKCIKSELVSLKFSEGTARLIQEEIQSTITPDQVGFSCNMNNDNLFFDNKGSAICTQGQLIASLEMVGGAEHVDNVTKLISKYHIPDGYFLKLIPSGKLIKPNDIIYENEIEKL